MNNSLSPLAGRPVPKSILVDLGRLERDYYERQAEESQLGSEPIAARLTRAPGNNAPLAGSRWWRPMGGCGAPLGKREHPENLGRELN
jgi:hypothetical protein